MFTIPTVDQSDVSLQLPTTTNTTIADHSHCRQKWPPCAPHEALRFLLLRWMDGQQPPKLGDIFLGGVEVCMALKTLQCCGNVHCQNKGALWGPCTYSTTQKKISACLGGCHPSIQSVSAERKASCGVLGGHFCWRWPWLWRLWRQLCLC